MSGAGGGSAGQDHRFEPRPDERPDDVVWPAMRWPVPGGTELVGPVVRLRRADPTADAEELFAALDDDRVWTHVPGRPADPGALAATLHERAGLGWHQWVVRAAADDRVVGITSYLDASASDARLEVGGTGYTPEVWATAVNPAAKLLLLGYAFETLLAGRVQLKTDVRNIRSQQAIARLGATCEGVLRRYQRRVDGTVRDTVVFSVTAEWPGVKDGLLGRLGPAG